MAARPPVGVTDKSVVVAGAGLAGSLLACYLRRRNLNVHLVERRPDPRKAAVGGGRSINLALSERGITALRGVGLVDDVMSIAIPMFGRKIHSIDGQQHFQPYSASGKRCIFSVSRAELNKRLLDCAEKAGASTHFDRQVTRFSSRTGELYFTDNSKVTPATVIATDGAFSVCRRSIMNVPNFDYRQEYHKHGYKELCIPPKEGTTEHQLEKNCLHIWPRGEYMMIALPNIDGSFTCTLFMQLKGPSSFEALDTQERVASFFKAQFPDAVGLMPTLAADFVTNPTGALMQVSCFPWNVDGKIALLGDACHAMVPFFGQGMNCAFEDVRVLDETIDAATKLTGAEIKWEQVFGTYQNSRKANADAICKMALENYIEMRDKVADKDFQFRSKVGGLLGNTYPDQFTSRYEVVSFSNLPYTSAIERGERNDKAIEEIIAGIADHDLTKIDLAKAKIILDKYFPLSK